MAVTAFLDERPDPSRRRADRRRRNRHRRSRGIGRAIVHTLAAAGMEVIFTYRDNTKAAAETMAAASGGKVTAEALDVRDSSACAALAEKVADRAGRIDLLVNNAGVIRDNALAALEDEDVRAVLDTN